MRTTRVEKSNTESFPGLNNENFVIFLDDKEIPVGAKLFPRRKEVTGEVLTFNGANTKVNTDPRLYLTVVQRLKDETEDIYRYWVNHNSELPEFSWPSEDLVEGMKYELREDVPWAVIPEPVVEAVIEEPRVEAPAEEPKVEEVPVVETKVEEAVEEKVEDGVS